MVSFTSQKDTSEKKKKDTSEFTLEITEGRDFRQEIIAVINMRNYVVFN